MTNAIPQARTVSAASAGSFRSASRLVLAGAIVIAVSILMGCALREDRTGVSRVGIGLWGFGDPPGVDWNLERPKGEDPASRFDRSLPRRQEAVPAKPDGAASKKRNPDATSSEAHSGVVIQGK